jgi:hypothetical protein
MTFVYFLLFILPIYAELSHKVATDGIIKKIWLGFICIGGAVAMGGGGTDLICYGVLLHLAQTVYYNLKFHRRRKESYGKA